jgi:hypothetical protein
MPILTKGVYGFEINPKKTPFGLLNDQQRANGIINTAAWFNGQGERIGTGDLSLKDMDHISKNIPLSELFFVLTEADAGWNLPQDMDRTAPGIEYVLNHAVWLIARTSSASTIIRVRSDFIGAKAVQVEQDGIKYFRTSREELVKALTEKPKTFVKKKLDEPQDSNDFKKTSAVAKPKTMLKSTKPSKAVAIGIKP